MSFLEKFIGYFLVNAAFSFLLYLILAYGGRALLGENEMLNQEIILLGVAFSLFCGLIIGLAKAFGWKGTKR